MSGRPKAVIILGMHRSGTSLLAKTLQSLGVYWGEENQMLSPLEDNPEGFWEHAEIVDVHENLLSNMSASWDTTKPLPDNWWLTNEVATSREKLKEIVLNRFSNEAIWGFKDPRTCLLLPLWKSILDELHIEPLYILCLRNPLNVAASLKKRNFFSDEKSYAIWTMYVLSSLYYTQNEQRMVISYDDLLDQRVKAGKKISKYLQIPYNEHTQAIMSSMPKSELRHGNYGLNQLWENPLVPSIVKEVYKIGLSGEKQEKDFLNGKLNSSIDNLYQNLVQTIHLFNHEQAHSMKIYWTDADGQFSESSSSYITVEASQNIRSY